MLRISAGAVPETKALQKDSAVERRRFARLLFAVMVLVSRPVALSPLLSGVALEET